MALSKRRYFYSSKLYLAIFYYSFILSFIAARFIHTTILMWFGCWWQIFHWCKKYSFQSSHQDCSTQAFTRFSYSRLFSLKSCAAIELAGEFGLGSLNNDWIDVRIAETSYVGLHLQNKWEIKFRRDCIGVMGVHITLNIGIT